ncbi:Uncharacterised protein [uncultured archaeon]|nr:Uncharacterised protein [uncultured archaeon]
MYLHEFCMYLRVLAQVNHTGKRDEACTCRNCHERTCFVPGNAKKNCINNKHQEKQYQKTGISQHVRLPRLDIISRKVQGIHEFRAYGLLTLSPVFFRVPHHPAKTTGCDLAGTAVPVLIFIHGLTCSVLRMR